MRWRTPNPATKCLDCSNQIRRWVAPPAIEACAQLTVQIENLEQEVKTAAEQQARSDDLVARVEQLAQLLDSTGLGGLCEHPPTRNTARFSMICSTT